MCAANICVRHIYVWYINVRVTAVIWRGTVTQILWHHISLISAAATFTQLESGSKCRMAQFLNFHIVKGLHPLMKVTQLHSCTGCDWCPLTTHTYHTQHRPAG